MKYSYKDIVFFCLKLVILFLLLWAVCKQLFLQNNLTDLLHTFRQGVNGQTLFFLALTVLLVIPNYLCETKKWRILMNPFYPLKWKTAIKGILAGTTMAIFTPNRVGEYVGRALYIPKKYVLETIAVTIVGSLSQMIIITGFGCLSLFFLNAQLIAAELLNTKQFAVLSIGVVFIMIGLCSIYYKINRLLGRMNRLNFLKKYVTKLQVLRQYTQKNLLEIQAWSMLKYAIFTSQFVLLLLAFNIPFSTTLFFMVMFIFLIQTIVTSVALIEIGIRTNVALYVLGLISSNSVGILSASLLLWIINLMLPAIVGAVLLFQIKNTGK